jgi:stress response protein YsnF
MVRARPPASSGDVKRDSASAAGSHSDLEQPLTMELREERLEARKQLVEAGTVRVRKAVEQVPRRLEVDAYAEEVTIKHVPVGRVVRERETPSPRAL